MKTPPLLLGLGLLFWGWETGYLFIGIIGAVLVEMPWLVRRRWEISPKDFYLVADLSALIFLVLAVYWYAADGPNVACLVPLAFFPLLGAQAYSTVEGVDWGAVSYSARRQAKKNKETTRRVVDFSYPYFVLTVFSAGAANSRTPGFYAGLFILSAYALWWYRSKRFSVLWWGALLLAVGSAGWVGQVGLHRLHLIVEARYVSWAMNQVESNRNPYHHVTAIGDVGQIKLSDRILFRVKPEEGPAPPSLLREACYNRYYRGQWYAPLPGFRVVLPRSNFVWELAPPPQKSFKATVSDYLSRGKGLLKLPSGAFRVDLLPAGLVERNKYGVVKIEDGPGLVNYVVHYGRGSPLSAPPEDVDLMTPEDEKRILSQLVDELDLTEKTPPEAIETVSAWFRRNFKYSLELPESKESATALTDFLGKTRTGHCEYFAAAAALLLRTAGIPSRYVTGYVVDEFSTLEESYVVRARHAHAWAQVYHDDAWHDFDATPPGWIGLEENEADFWQPFTDLTSWLWFKFSAWRYGAGRADWVKYLVWPLIGLLILMVFRMKSKKTVLKSNNKRKADMVKPGPGLDSPVYAIEKKLASLGYVRPPWQTLPDFFESVGRSGGLPKTNGLEDLLALHLKLRFDPKGISIRERDRLVRGVSEYLSKMEG